MGIRSWRRSSFERGGSGTLIMTCQYFKATCQLLRLWYLTHRSVCTERESCCGACRSLTCPSLFNLSVSVSSSCTVEMRHTHFGGIGRRSGVVIEMECAAVEILRPSALRKVPPTCAPRDLMPSPLSSIEKVQILSSRARTVASLRTLFIQ